MAARIRKKQQEKKKGGRPSSFDPEKCEQARKLCLLGATNEELADFFSVSVDTIHEWKKVHPSFSDAIKSGKDQADANVADRLYQRAMGYEHPEVHISNYQGEITMTPITKIYAPDPTAAIFWLKNRQSAKWRDIKAVEMSGSLSVKKSAADYSDDELLAIVNERHSAKA